MDNAFAAELGKLRTLPEALLGFGASLGAAVLMAVALAAADPDLPAASIAVDVVPFVQALVVVVGILPAGQEFAGRQLSISAIAVPDRWLLLGAKTAAALLAVGLTAVFSVAVAVVAAGLTSGAAWPELADYGRLAGAACYLTGIGMLGHVCTVLLRGAVPALIVVLSLVLVLSPTLGALGDGLRWLPDRAGSQLYESTDPVLEPVAGGLVLLAWVAVIGVFAAARWERRDLS